MPQILHADADARFLIGLAAGVSQGIVRAKMARNGLWAACAGLLALAATVVADAARGLPAGRGWVYGAVAAGAVGAVGAALALPWRRIPSIFASARLVERARPELKNGLVTFLEMARNPSDDRVRAVSRRAARALSDARPVDFLPSARLRGPATAAAMAAGTLGIALWMAQGALFDPWAAGAEAAVATPEGSAGGVDTLIRSDPGRDAETALTLAPAAITNPSSPPPEDGASEAGETGSRGGESGQGPSRGGPEGSADGALASSIAANSEVFDRLAAALGEEPGPPLPGPEATEDGPGTRPDGTSGGVDETGENGPGAGSIADSGGHAGGSGPPPGRYEGPPPVPERPQPEGLPEEVLARTRWAEKVARKAEERLREGEVSDALLRDVGVSPEEFRRFVRNWRRKVDGDGGPSETALAGPRTRKTVPDEGALVRATGQNLATPSVGGTGLGPDGVRSVASESGEVAGRLKPAVKAYFEALKVVSDTP